MMKASNCHVLSLALSKPIFVPSGDHFGLLPDPKLLRLEPSAFMTKISQSPLRSDSNTISIASGDQRGCLSHPSSFVRFTRLAPFEFMTKISAGPRTTSSTPPSFTNLWSPGRSDAKRIFVPSGDQTRSARTSSSSYRLTGSVPSGFITKSEYLSPSRFDEKRMRVSAKTQIATAIKTNIRTTIRYFIARLPYKSDKCSVTFYFVKTLGSTDVKRIPPNLPLRDCITKRLATQTAPNCTGSSERI